MNVQPPSPPYRGPATWHGDDDNKPIARIVVHATDGTEPGVPGAAEGTVRGSKATTRPSSFHYVADSKVSLQYVYDSVVAYHAPPNDHSIGYELCCDLSNDGQGHWTRPDHAAMLDIAAEDIARLCLAYDVPIVKLTVDDLKAGKHGLCGHIDVSNAWHQTTHWDPGPYFPWPAFIAKVRAAADRLTKNPPKPDGERLELGTFNLLRGRQPNVVLHEVLRLVDAADLVGLAVQEAEGYFEALSTLRDFDYFADPDNRENGILVVEGRGSDFFSHEVGDGWTREGGAQRGPGVFPRVTIDGWCRVGSQHWPPSTNWKDGRLVAPPERVDDVRAWAEASARFFERDNLTRVLLSDYNEKAATRGELSPGWVALQAGAQIGTDGGIDWGMGVRARFEDVRTSPIRERSDHEPRVMTVVQAP